MGTTQEQIGSWYDDGLTAKWAYMAVWCDTYDWSDYPSYYPDEESAQEAINKNGENMQKVMEVYVLDSNRKIGQLAQKRCWALRPQMRIT